jgi:rhamnose utilization protein RhaD (predicted bifunctional aldolase and dehydrogenase)
LPNPHKFGILTPEHVLRTKRYPLYLDDDKIKEKINLYIKEYETYFNKYKKDETMLNPAPNWAVVKDYGIITFGKDDNECKAIEDIVLHTIEAIFKAQKFGGFESINEAETFAMEYWELEQAKLKK